MDFLSLCVWRFICASSFNFAHKFVTHLYLITKGGAKNTAVSSNVFWCFERMHTRIKIKRKDTH